MTGCRNSCCHFPTFLVSKDFDVRRQKSEPVDRVMFSVNFPETLFLFVFFLEIIRIYLQHSIYNTTKTYFEKNKQTVIKGYSVTRTSRKLVWTFWSSFFLLFLPNNVGRFISRSIDFSKNNYSVCFVLPNSCEICANSCKKSQKRSLHLAMRENWSSNINEVIRPVLNFLFFLYDNISQVQRSAKKHQKAPKSIKKHLSGKKVTYLLIYEIHLHTIYQLKIHRHKIYQFKIHGHKIYQFKIYRHTIYQFKIHQHKFYQV